ncbi:MAG: AAA family ATPase [Candidatus Marithrix sp.]
MKLLRLYIHNSGVFKNTLIDFTHHGEPQNLICLAGVNGSGKTTVMELIFNLINFINPDLSEQNIFFDRLRSNVLTWTEFAQLDVLIEDKVLSLVLGDEKNIQIDSKCTGEQSFIIENEIKSMIKYFENNIVKTPDDDNKSIFIKKLTGTREIKRFSNRKIDRRIEENIVKPLIQKLEKIYREDEVITQDILQTMPSVYFFNAHDREIQDIRYSSIPQEKLKYEIAHRYNPNKDDLKKMLVFYDYARTSEFNNLKNWVNTHVLVGKKIKEIDRVNFQVVIETNKNKEKHGLELLSSGEKSLLILATQLYLRASENVIFLIDEVDQSLHPEFQEKVMRVIKQLQKDKGCQILISSHSRITWNAFKEQEIIDLTELVI